MITPFCPICSGSVEKSICLECGYNQSTPDPPEIKIEPSEAKKLIDSGITLIDVRRDDELEAAKISGSVHIQLDTLPQNLSALDKSKLIITHCHHGIRSLHAARFLCQKGFHARSLDGGIERWAIEIDEKIPRY